MPTTIYRLIDPRTNQIRYIGKTCQDPREYKTKYFFTMRDDFYVCRWVNSLLREGFRPIFEIIETVPDGGDWGERETYWIAKYKATGCSLCNLTSGGEGAPGHYVSEETREKIGLSKRGKPRSPETRAKLSAANKGKRLPQEQRDKIGATHRGMKRPPETGIKIGLSKKGKKRKPETIAKMSAALKGHPAWNKGKKTPPETREKLSKAHTGLPSGHKGRKLSPEARAKIRAAHARRRKIKGQLSFEFILDRRE